MILCRLILARSVKIVVKGMIKARFKRSEKCIMKALKIKFRPRRQPEVTISEVLVSLSIIFIRSMFPTQSEV